MPDDPKDVLHRYLRAGREALLWELEGLDEHDGAVGLREDDDNTAGGDRDWWQRHRARVQQAAEQAAGRAGGNRRQETRA